MKIIFTSSNTNSPSFQFYASSLSKINDMYPDISLGVKDNPLNINYSDYDVALFMSFKDDSYNAKKVNPTIITGVVEPRIDQKNTFVDTDFIIVNSIESRDYFSRFKSDIMIYYTYPEVPAKMECPVVKNHLVLGYHGNRLHLNAMFPRITRAIEKVNEKNPVELWAMYNIKNLGKWQIPDRANFSFDVKHIQFSEENYARYLAHVDIGLIPQLIPVRESRILRYLIGTPDRKYNERLHNYFLRFKETTNIGRHLVFAQYKIPVICDMSPSSCSYIEDEGDGFVAYHTEGWYRALKRLAYDEGLRTDMGKKLNIKYKKTATPEVQNQKLVSFINDFISAKRSKRDQLS